MFSNRNKTNLENNNIMNNQKWLGAFQYYSWCFFLLWNNGDERLGGFNSLNMDPILRAKEMTIVLTDSCFDRMTLSLIIIASPFRFPKHQPVQDVASKSI